MAVVGTGSRTNPYSSRGEPLAWSPRVMLASAIVLLLWLMALLAVVEESPGMRKEVAEDVQRKKGKLRRLREKAEEGMARKKGKLRHAINNEKRWLKGRLGTDDEPPAGPAPAPGHPWELTRPEDSALQAAPDGTQLHIVFSTDCSPYQRWQSYAFFLSALRVRQPGRITQIASGCDEKEADGIGAWFREQVAPLSSRFGLHLTPHFSSVEDASGNTVGDYAFFNKPYGLKHWMESGDGMGVDAATGLPWKHDTIVALLDPDQVLLRPITGHFRSPQDIFRGGPPGDGSGGDGDSATRTRENSDRFTVRHGHPASQEYGFGGAWRKYASVAGAESPATKVTAADALRSYAVGPPYLATALDMYGIAVKWCDFVPLVHAAFPELLAEMYAFSIATAHLHLPHQLLASLMVSDTSTDRGGEGWAFVDAIPGEEVCPFGMGRPEDDAGAPRPLPTVLHFCHRYGVGDRDFFAKKKVPRDFFACGSGLLGEPDPDIGSGKYLYRKPPFVDKRVAYSAVTEKREAFAICSMIGFLNEASLFFKGKHCDDGANFKKDIYLHDLPE